jgi:mono/diheme cytochrome c family protein
VTEVPEYLLQRSRERRRALGLLQDSSEGEGGAPPPPPPAASGAAEPDGEPEGAGLPAEVEPAAAAVATIEAPVYVGPVKPPSRTGVPVWMLPVLVLLPFWAVLYAGTFQTHKSGAALTPIQLGAQIYSGKGTCAGCHGAHGEGGVGPRLAGGQAKLTFPNMADHIAWVDTGSQTKPKGTPYGDPNRPGGQHHVEVGAMPAFKGVLTDAEIQAVVTYEREGL